MTSPDLVPFGKYKGQAVERLLADRDYCQWLAAQPWFRDRFAPVYNIIIGAGGEPQDTPEHNAMQARFLDHPETLRLAERWLPSGDAMRETWQREDGRKLTDLQRANLVVGAAVHAVTSLKFEAGGWDLLISAESRLPVTEVTPASSAPCTCSCQVDSCPPRRAMLPEAPAAEWSGCYAWDSRTRSRHCFDGCMAGWVHERQMSGYVMDTEYVDAREGVAATVRIGVELKPVVGDDYPTVLRQVLRRCAAGYDVPNKVVLADRAAFVGVTLDQVRRIFASQGVTFLTAADLAPALPCGCASCTRTAS